MNISKILKTIGLFALIVGFAFFADTYVGKTSVVSAQIEEVKAVPDSVGQDIVDLLSSFNKVRIDSSLFSSSLFRSLRDFRVEIIREKPGRSNPFAPIGSFQSSQTTNTVTNTPKTPVKTSR